jgi:hypothetical protein
MMLHDQIMLAGKQQFNVLEQMWRKKRPTWAEYFRALVDMEYRKPKCAGKTEAQLQKQRRRNHRRYRDENGVRRRVPA